MFEAVMCWVRYDDDARSKYLKNLLKHVRLPLLSAKFLTDIVDEEVCITFHIIFVKKGIKHLVTFPIITM